MDGRKEREGYHCTDSTSRAHEVHKAHACGVLLSNTPQAGRRWLSSKRMRTLRASPSACCSHRNERVCLCIPESLVDHAAAAMRLVLLDRLLLLQRLLLPTCAQEERMQLQRAM